MALQAVHSTLCSDPHRLGRTYHLTRLTAMSNIRPRPQGTRIAPMSERARRDRAHLRDPRRLQAAHPRVDLGE